MIFDLLGALYRAEKTLEEDVDMLISSVNGRVSVSVRVWIGTDLFSDTFVLPSSAESSVSESMLSNTLANLQQAIKESDY